MPTERDAGRVNPTLPPATAGAGYGARGRDALREERSVRIPGSRSTGSPGRSARCLVWRCPCPPAPPGERNTKIKARDEHRVAADFPTPVEKA